MKKLLAILACTSALSAPVLADDAPKLTMNDCVTILQGLQQLDGHQVILNEGKPNESTVQQPYRFGSATLRLDIGQNIARLTPLTALIEKTRQQIFSEVAKGSADIKPGTPEMAEYSKQLVALGESACPVALIPLKGADLKLDVNEIPGTVLAALGKILEK